MGFGCLLVVRRLMCEWCCFVQGKAPEEQPEEDVIGSDPKPIESSDEDEDAPIVVDEVCRN
jgi:hypothetical protein